MPRPKKHRCVECRSNVPYFKPRGIRLVDLEVVCINADELEAVRLADHEGLYHEQAAMKMSVSRPTFSRILGEARRKVAEALVEGKALKIEITNEPEVTI